MDTLTHQEVRQEVLKAYRKKHTGWHAYLVRTPDGFYNVIYVGPDNGWQLKVDSIFSGNPICYGGSFDLEGLPMVSNQEPYGFTPIPFKKMLEFGKKILEAEAHFNSGNRGKAEESLNAADQITNEIRKAIDKPPVPLDSIQQPVAVEGWFHVSDKPLVFGESQRKLDEKLKNEVRRLFHSRNPQYG